MVVGAETPWRRQTKVSPGVRYLLLEAIAMEHRWGTRKHLGKEVTLYRDGKDGAYLGQAQAVDMNLNGIGLKCDLELRAGQVVEVELPHGDERVRCLVIHAGHNRCGLMFLSLPERRRAW